MSFEVLIFYVLLADSIIANIMIWTGGKWYITNSSFSRYFPAAKGWGLLYLVLVLWIGSLLGVY